MSLVKLPGSPERGFTLVEMMIGLALGLLIMTALTTLFVDMSRNNREMAKTNSQIENARFALQILQDDLVHAGYWGGYVPEFDDLTFDDPPTDVPGSADVNDATNVPSPCLAYASWNLDYARALLGIPVQFYNAAAASGCSSVVTNKKANTDIVVVRHAETCQLTYRTSSSAWEPGYYDADGNWQSNGCDGEDAGTVYFQPSRCELEISAGSRYVLGKTGFSLHALQCVAGTPITGPLAPKYKLVSNIYYVRDYAVTVGDGIPTLVRSSFEDSGGTPAHQAAVPLVEGIEGLRIELGVDRISDSNNNVITAADVADRYYSEIKWANEDERDSPTNRGDGVPDIFVHCGGACTPAQLSNVSAARIYVLARANEATPGYTDTKTYTLGERVPVTLGPFNDGFKRHVFSTSIRFVNITSRRETP